MIFFHHYKIQRMSRYQQKLKLILASQKRNQVKQLLLKTISKTFKKETMTQNKKLFKQFNHLQCRKILILKHNLKIVRKLRLWGLIRIKLWKIKMNMRWDKLCLSTIKLKRLNNILNKSVNLLKYQTLTIQFNHLVFQD